MEPRSKTSDAKRQANRRNAKLSTGPSLEARNRTRFNARKHGLTASVLQNGQHYQRDNDYFQHAFEVINPRNGIEEIYVQDLLNARFKERLALEAERKALTHKPVLLIDKPDLQFPFVWDALGLKSFERLGRYVTRFGNSTERAFHSLLRARKENWKTANKPRSSTRHAKRTQCIDTGPGTLQGLLADTTLVLPEEDKQAFEALALKLWDTIRPETMLECLLVTDIVSFQWRYNRLDDILSYFLETNAASVWRHKCGPAFGLFQHSQDDCSIVEILEQYQAILRKRLEKRHTLLSRLRKDGWTEDCSAGRSEEGQIPGPADDCIRHAKAELALWLASAEGVADDRQFQACSRIGPEPKDDPLPESETTPNTASNERKKMLEPEPEPPQGAETSVSKARGIIAGQEKPQHTSQAPSTVVVGRPPAETNSRETIPKNAPDS